MRTLTLYAILVCLLSSGLYAQTVAVWNGPTGSWMEGDKWNIGTIPPVGSGTSAEIKITTNGTVCTVDSVVPDYVCRLSVASGPDGATLEITPGGYLAMGETRIGPAGATSAGSIGFAEQTGGTLTVKDLVLGRWSSGRPTGQGYYTISGGLLTYTQGETGRLYIGGGNNGGYCEGTMTVIGTEPQIVFRSLYIGNETDGRSGKGTLAFHVDADGVSPVTILENVFISMWGGQADLVLAALDLPPAADIVLVNVTGSNAVNGTFDSVNGSSAHEGAAVILGDKIYTLTYQYAATGGVTNDVALVFKANLTDLAHDPYPVDGQVVETTLAALSWTLPDPNDGLSSILCDVYLGTEPNRLAMDKVTLSPDVSVVDINTANFPNFGALVNRTTYYWVVDCHDPSYGPEPIEGLFWSFYPDDNEPPVVDAGPDQVVWLGKSAIPGQETVTLAGVTSDDGLPYGYLERLWSQVETDASPVAIVNPDQDVATVTFTQRGVYVFMLTADDGDKQTSDTVEVIVGSNACDASHMSTGDPYHPADVNQDCLVDLADFVILIASDWLVCTDVLTHCGF